MDDRSGGMSGLASELQAVFDRLSAGFAANDFQAVAAEWDESDPAPFYLAEERDVLIADWPALRDYWQATEAINLGCQTRWTVGHAKPLGDGHALALFDLDWRMAIAGEPEPYGGFCRGMAVFTRREPGWRLTGYAEAPLSPLTYLKKLYVRVGRDLA